MDKVLKARQRNMFCRTFGTLFCVVHSRGYALWAHRLPVILRPFGAPFPPRYARLPLWQGESREVKKARQIGGFDALGY